MRLHRLDKTYQHNLAVTSFFKMPLWGYRGWKFLLLSISHCRAAKLFACNATIPNNQAHFLKVLTIQVKAV